MNCKDLNTAYGTEVCCKECKWEQEHGEIEYKHCHIETYFDIIKGFKNKKQFKTFILNMIKFDWDFLHFVQIVVEKCYPQYFDTMNKIILLK